MTKISRLKKICFWTLLVLVIDLISKWLTQEYLPQIRWNTLFYPYGGIGIFKDFFGVQFSIVHETNQGAAWGAFANYQSYLLYVRVALIIALFGYLIFLNRNEKSVVPFTLIFAGAIGNVIDFFVYGHVIDMFYFKFGPYSYPIFNVADSAIFLGVFWLCFYTMFAKTESKKTRKA